MSMSLAEDAEPPEMSYDTARRVVLAAGGTGGHMFPAEAVAAELLARGHRIALLTDERGGGRDSAVFAGHPVHVVKGAGIAGRGAARAAQAGIAIGVGSLQARSLLRGLKPSAIVGFGGYPTVAPVLGSKLLRGRVPVVLHEQNAVLGRSNRALARRASAVALSFAQTRLVPDGASTVVTGNPVRAAIAALAGRSYAAPGEGEIRLLVIGGSLGARVFSDYVPPALAGLPAALRARLRVVQQCRAENLPEVASAYHQAGITAELAPFFADIAARLGAAHLVIARAGASTVAELAAVGLPAILVPLPSAVDDHQADNAASLGGAWTLRQEAFNAGSLGPLLTRLVEDQTLLTKAAMAASGCGRPRAAQMLADLTERMIRKARA